MAVLIIIKVFDCSCFHHIMCMYFAVAVAIAVPVSAAVHFPLQFDASCVFPGTSISRWYRYTLVDTYVQLQTKICVMF